MFFTTELAFIEFLGVPVMLVVDLLLFAIVETPKEWILNSLDIEYFIELATPNQEP